MKRRVSLYLVGSVALISLAGCGRGLFQFQEREPWRAEAEAACLKSGAVREGVALVRVKPISGPGVCGAEFPLKVAALGESNSRMGFANDLRPPGAIGGSQPRWPVQQQQAQPPREPDAASFNYKPAYGSRTAGAPVSLSAPPSTQDTYAEPRQEPQRVQQGYPAQPQRVSEQPRFGFRESAPMVTGSVTIKPEATLACPIVSALDRWLAEAIQPAAMRWFGSRVTEIRQISAYSCRGMNGNSRAKISEHAFGNALDIAAFTFADGRQISVKNGWKGMPEEQGFLRDVQAAACDQFTTVLAPGSNVYHYDHIHVDLMRRKTGRGICRPAAVSGEEVASRAAQRGGSYASSNSRLTTGSIGARKKGTSKQQDDDEDDYRNE